MKDIQPWFSMFGLLCDLVGVIWAFTNWPRIVAVWMRKRDVGSLADLEKLLDAQEHAIGKRLDTAAERNSDLVHSQAVGAISGYRAHASMQQALISSICKRLNMPAVPILDNFGLLSRSKINVAAEAILAEHRVQAKFAYPWETPVKALALIILGFVLQIVGSWPLS